MAEAENWVTQSEAARLETSAGRPVAQSSISRFIAANTDVPVRRDDRGAVKLVEYGALARARSQSLGVQDKLEARHESERRSLKAPVETTGLQTKRDLEVEKLQLDLAERKGELLPRAAVDLAIRSAGVAFAQRLERRRRTLAGKLTGLNDTRAIEHELKTADREMLQALADDLRKAAGNLEAPDASADAAAA